MIRTTPGLKWTDTRFPYTTLIRSLALVERVLVVGAARVRHFVVEDRLAACVTRHVLAIGILRIRTVRIVHVEQTVPEDMRTADLAGGERCDIQQRCRARQQILRQQTAGLILERSEEHTSELQSLMRISYTVFCLKKNKSNQA